MFESWTLETLETGGHAGAPWQYGRSVVHGRSGQTMETYFVGLLRRTAAGDLKFVVDAFTRERRDGGEADAARVTDAYLKAVERADARALGDILDDQFVIVSASTARTKAQGDRRSRAGVRRDGRVLPPRRSRRRAASVPSR